MEHPQDIVKASEVTGVKVMSIDHDNIGEINDVVLDKISGKVNYVVLDFGGFLSFGNKFFAMPWNLFSYDKNEDCFVIPLHKDELKNAPGFPKDKWPDFATPSFSKEMDYYRPYAKKYYANMRTELFQDKDSAEKAYQSALQKGYKPEEVNVLMSEDTRKKYYDSALVQKETGSKALEGMGVGSLVGGTVGGALGAIAAIGTSLIFPGMGIIIAGPIAAGLAGLGAGGLSGGLIGALIGLGIPEEKAKIYESGIKSGGIVLGVNETADRKLDDTWQRKMH